MQTLKKQFIVPELKNWGSIEELTQNNPHGISAFGGGGSNCNQGLGNGSEGCDPGNSNNNQPSNDEPGGGRGNNGGRPGRG